VYYVSSAIVSEADKLDYLPGKKQPKEPEPTQDAATAIAYNAYPSSARPVI
jgi:hypothetical protein